MASQNSSFHQYYPVAGHSPEPTPRSITSPYKDELPRRNSSNVSTAHQSSRNDQQHESCIWLPFLGLFVTTCVSTLLLYASAYNITFPGYYTFMVANRATIQIVVQILAALMGTLQIAALCRLINYGTRLRMLRPFKVADLSFWTSMSFAHLRWNLPAVHLSILIVFLICCAVVPALWAGAMSPVAALASIQTSIMLPAYTDISNIREWVARQGATGPTTRTSKGLFTFYPAMMSAGDLTKTMTTGTTPDASTRVHAKFDNTGYRFIGRSFGVAASVGLTDSFDAVSYSYQEAGYSTETTCIFNSSSEFFLSKHPIDGQSVYAATGYLPDSTESEYSTYLGHGSHAIVAIGVAMQQHIGSQYLAIVSGEDYLILNNTQCQTIYTPSQFLVNVNVVGKNISVSKLNINAPDIDPSGNLTHNTHRSIASYSADLTNEYISEIGNALLQSITDFGTATNKSSTEKEVVLGGITNSITALLDDMLGFYAAAQLMVQNDTVSATAQASINAVRFGQREYIIAVMVLNCLILMGVLFEAFRTNCWRNLLTYDYCDPGSLVVATSKGRMNIADCNTMVHIESMSTGYVIVGDERTAKYAQRNGRSVE